MFNINLTSIKISNYIGKELQYTPQQVDTIRYGLEIIIGGIIKGLLIFSIAYILGIFKLVLISTITIGFLRLISVGAHCTSYNRCLVFSLFFLVLIIKISNFVLPLFDNVSIVFIAILTIILGIYSAIKYVPLKNYNREIKNKKKIKFLKILTIGYLLCWFIIVYVCNNYSNLFNIYIIVSSFSLLFHLASLFPVGRFFIEKTDHLLSNIIN